MLQHCLKELEAELRNQDSWKTAEDLRRVITILFLIQNLSFNKMDRKRSSMSTVEADADLYLGTKRPDQSMDNFYKTFTAQVETINANRGIVGFHNGVYNKHMLELWDRNLVTTNLLAAMSPAKKSSLENRIQKKRQRRAAARSTSCAYYYSWWTRKGSSLSRRS